MPTVVYVETDGTRHEAQVAPGKSVMEGAVLNLIEGIVAECGGSCMCATCHVYVDPAFAGRLPEPEEGELEMLENTAAERRETSRLSCQIEVTDALDGLVVHLPDRQV